MRIVSLVLLLLVAIHPVRADDAPGLLLANVYHDGIDLTQYWVSEKYDGMRAYWNGHVFVTRNGNRIVTPDWFVAGWPTTPLDGELWMGHGTFEALVAAVRDPIPQDAAWRRIRFMVFDMPEDPRIFTDRLTALRNLIAVTKSLSLQAVPQWHVTSKTQLRQQLGTVVAAGGEGLMLHRADSMYHALRSDDLLKLKLCEDAEARVIAYLPGKGRYRNMLGALRVESPDGRQFNLGTGFSDEQRRHPPPIGSWVTYTFRGRTARGLPRFASFLRVRSDMPAMAVSAR